MTLDTAIVNGTIIDGTGNPGYPGSVGIRNGRIVSIGRHAGHAARCIDARGLILAPGFIDIHTHSGAALLADPRGVSAVSQGVTTHVTGNCGNSVFPPAKMLRPLFKRFGLDPTWEDLRGYISRIRKQGVGLNIAPLVGQGTVRSYVMGDTARMPSPHELAAMKRLIAQAMEQGAFGMSTGLIYPPGCFSETDELVELAKVVHDFGGLYASHIRNEGAGLVDAVLEAVSIGERAGVPVQISHLKATHPRWRGRVGEVLNLLDTARERGVDVTWDQYPYTATSTGLNIFVPGWAHEGGADALERRLHDPASRQRILTEMRQSGKDWSEVLIISCPAHPDWKNLTPVQIGARLGLPPEEAVLEVLSAEGAEAKMANFVICEEDIETILRHPVTMVGSDGVATAAEGPLGHLPFHPRCYGTFPRLLDRYVREKGVLTLEEAVRRMTSAPAKRLGLSDRGRLQEGMQADITVFDPARIADRAVFTRPDAYAEGIVHVLVNGEPVIESGGCTGGLPGQVLLKPPRRSPDGAPAPTLQRAM